MSTVSGTKLWSLNRVFNSESSKFEIELEKRELPVDAQGFASTFVFSASASILAACMSNGRVVLMSIHVTTRHIFNCRNNIDDAEYQMAPTLICEASFNFDGNFLAVVLNNFHTFIYDIDVYVSYEQTIQFVYFSFHVCMNMNVALFQHI